MSDTYCSVHKVAQTVVASFDATTLEMAWMTARSLGSDFLAGRTVGVCDTWRIGASSCTEESRRDWRSRDHRWNKVGRHIAYRRCRLEFYYFGVPGMIQSESVFSRFLGIYDKYSYNFMRKEDILLKYSEQNLFTLCASLRVTRLLRLLHQSLT